jgi:hypothetical protein
MGLSTQLGTRHLDSNVACSWSAENHHMGFYINHTTSSITILDSGNNAKRFAHLALVLNNYFHSERARCKRAVCADYAVVIKPVDLALQGDGNSCGLFVFVFFYFIVFHKRWPTRVDIGSTPSAAMALRLAVLEMCATNRVRRPICTAEAAASAAEESLNTLGYAEMGEVLPTYRSLSQQLLSKRQALLTATRTL